MNLMEKKKYVDENIKYVPSEELAMWDNNFACVFARNSSCMEGYQITLEEVVSITKGFSVKCDGTLGRSVHNHYLAYNMVKDYAKDNKVLTEDFFKDVHERVVSGIIQGGLYRNVDISIKGSNHTPCSYIKVYDRMSKFFYDINNYQGSDIERAAYAHLQIAKVHPFLDGNGRMARLMMNYVLISSGYLPLSIPLKYRDQYFNALEEFKVNKTVEPFMELMLLRLEREYDKMIDIINQFKK